MRSSSMVLLASLGLVLGGCGWQSREQPKPEPVAIARPTIATQQLASNDGSNSEQVICRHEDVTGSRLEGRRVCHTRAEWGQIKLESLEKLKLLGAGPP
ncbi:MAG TPA: hypothetical protein VFE13_18725 [Caulobacteraceae bacterium]|jgi:outer membrane lipopolysaccharide assembly protein LptE/RlpB|nr:hypothetical protein [Caulobacteraceae bacterium]